MKPNKGRRILITLLVFFTTFFSTYLTAAADELSNDFTINAKAALSIDLDSGKILYSQNIDEQLGIASITKIISLYIVEREVAEGRLNWDDPVVISEELAELSQNWELSNVPLEANQSYTVRELFESAAIQSANAATMALAEKISGSEIAFVEKMRQQLAEWGIENPQIINSSGLPNNLTGVEFFPGTAEEDENELSAREVAIIARHLILDFPEILTTTATASKQFGSDSSAPVTMASSNWMLPGMPYAKEGVDGLKTGTTDLAGPCFVGTMEKDGQRILTVVLNSTSEEDPLGTRFTETGRLMDYTFDNWTKKEVIAADMVLPTFSEIPVHLGQEETITLSSETAITTWVHSSTDINDIQVEVNLNPDLTHEQSLKAPIEKGEIVGTASITSLDSLGYLEAEQEKNAAADLQTNLQATQTVEQANIFVRFLYMIQSWINTIGHAFKEGIAFFTAIIAS